MASSMTMGSESFRRNRGAASSSSASPTSSAADLPPLDPAVLAAFAEIPSPTISAVLNGMGVRAWLSGGPAPGYVWQPLSAHAVAARASVSQFRACLPHTLHQLTPASNLTSPTLPELHRSTQRTRASLRLRSRSEPYPPGAMHLMLSTFTTRQCSS
jgi:hypothetical protein